MTKTPAPVSAAKSTERPRLCARMSSHQQSMIAAPSTPGKIRHRTITDRVQQRMECERTAAAHATHGTAEPIREDKREHQPPAR
jgi:hypothetical protein